MNKVQLSTNEQVHLSIKDTTNLGSFYTPANLVKLVIDLVKPYFFSNAKNSGRVVILDSSAGYGAFLEPLKETSNLIIKASDIDEYAYQVLQTRFNDVYNLNALYNVNRINYKILPNDFLIIIGNPPYNDRTSQVKQIYKQHAIKIDEYLHSRDLGISFLKAYNQLNADIICVLHPFAYLAKQANFKQLKDFGKNYKLQQATIFSSQVFSGTSRATPFPVCMALYTRDLHGMDYNYIKQFNFSILDEYNTKFKLANLDSIANYVNKYPRKEISSLNLYFYTIRDINALKRNKTFLSQINSGSIPVSQDNLYWYCYIDVFKEFSNKLPYYYGNCDVFVNSIEFKRIAHSFFLYSFVNNSVLNTNVYANLLYKKLRHNHLNFNTEVIEYFKHLF